MPTRRTLLLGLGGATAGTGALLGTGAFTTVEAERSVALETADDSDAFLGFEVLDEHAVDETDGTIEFDLLADATTRYEGLVNVRNNGTQTVMSLRFEFDVSGAEQPDGAVEDALKVVSGDATIDAIDEANLLLVSDEGGAGDDELDPGEAVPFGIEVDLTGDIHEVSGDPDTTLTIIADTEGSGGGGGGSGDEETEGDDSESDGPPDGSIMIVSVERGNRNNGNGDGDDEDEDGDEEDGDDEDENGPEDGDGNGNVLTVTVEVTTNANDAEVKIRTQGDSGPTFGVKNDTNQYSKKIGAGNAETVEAILLDGEDNEIATDTETIGD